MYQIQKCSPQAQAMFFKYPFNELEIGQCFIVSINEISKYDMNMTAMREGAVTNKCFSVIEHNDLKCLEIVRTL